LAAWLCDSLVYYSGLYLRRLGNIENIKGIFTTKEKAETAGKNKDFLTVGGRMATPAPMMASCNERTQK
jgi:hypothetical protein